MILIKRKDGTVQVIPQGAVRMVEYLPSPGVLRIHFLGGEPSLDVRVSGGKGAFCLELFARQQVVQLEEDGVGEVQGQVGQEPGEGMGRLTLAYFYSLLGILGWYIFFRNEDVLWMSILVYAQLLPVVALIASLLFHPKIDYILPVQGALTLTAFFVWGALAYQEGGVEKALPALLGLFYLPLFFFKGKKPGSRLESS